MNRLFALNFLRHPDPVDAGEGDATPEVSISADGGRRSQQGRRPGTPPKSKVEPEQEADEAEGDDAKEPPARGRKKTPADDGGVSVDGEEPAARRRPAPREATDKAAKGKEAPGPAKPKKPAAAPVDAEDELDEDGDDAIDDTTRQALRYVPGLTPKAIEQLEKTPDGRTKLREKAEAFIESLGEGSDERGRGQDPQRQDDDEQDDRGRGAADPIEELLSGGEPRENKPKASPLTASIDPEQLKQLRTFVGDETFDKTIAPLALSVQRQGEVITRQADAIRKLNFALLQAIDNLELARVTDSWNDPTFGSSADLSDEHVTARGQLRDLAYALLRRGIKGPGGRRLTPYQAMGLARMSLTRKSAVAEAREGIEQELQRRSRGTGVVPRRGVASPERPPERSRKAAVSALTSKMKEHGLL